MTNDPWETKNLAFDSDHRAACNRLAGAIDDTESQLDNVELPAKLMKGAKG